MTKILNKIEKLISKLCPYGVEFMELGELGNLENIGVDKKIVNGQTIVMLLNYMDVYSKKHINKKTLTMKVSASDAKIKSCNIEKGDIFITPTSETIDDIGHATVSDEDIPGAVYSYHIMRIRLHKKNNVTPYYISYLFDSDVIQAQILKSATGMTRFGLKKSKFGSIKIPLPPLVVQEQIVKILNSFTELEAELEAELETELEARKHQYEHYREKLLSIKDVEYKTLRDVGTLVRGNGLQKKDFVESGVGCIHYGQIYTYYGTFADKTKTFVSEELAKKLKKAQKGDVLISGVSENIEDVCKPLAWLGDEICISGDMFAFRHNQNTKYITYLLQTLDFKKYKKRYAQGAKVTRVKADRILDYKIPVPPLAEQDRIVKILDRFNAMVNDISICLPAELSARRQQYEYYRGKLLSFDEYAKK